MSPGLPSLAQFEHAVAAGDRATAFSLAIDILRAVDRLYGGLAQVDLGAAAGSPDVEAQFADRFCPALLTLMEQETDFAGRRFALLVSQHRWIDVLLSLCAPEKLAPFRKFLQEAPGSGLALRKHLTVLPTFSAAPADLPAWEAIDAPATHTGLLHLIGSRYCFTHQSYALRERVLEWLPGRIGEAPLADFEPRMLVEPYMQSSYAMSARKHAIKADIIAQMRAFCLKAGCAELTTPPPRNAKPTVVVTTEGFGIGHSVFRTHSKAVRSLRERFHVVGLCFQASLNAPAVRDCFDQVLFYPSGDFMDVMRIVAQQVIALKPAMTLQLGVGMSPHTIALASLRLAPVQCASFSHTATTMSPFVDHMVIPDTFVSAKDRFSEPLLLLPMEAMPYASRAEGDDISAEARSAPPRRRGKDDVIRIALPAAIMKLNPHLFDAVARIVEQASRPTEVHFFPLGGVGLGYAALQRAVKIKNAVVHRELDYRTYLRQVAACDFFLSPFPYGNVNSVVDAIRVGVPGVCLDGPEPHAHADTAFFSRADLPSELIAHSVDGYVANAVRLIDDLQWLDHCREAAASADFETRLYNGQPAQFCDAMAALLN